ncbi:MULTISPECIES: DUF805 domain-containing protein [Micromonosporaceae]|uniref:DUF805 domain-containing protein n=1 Tax=Micromonosporaceae TaxID=28056 RepID=UPI00248BBF22|nr:MULTISPECIES: DUF805 domain-containing protein [unclassified Solwaraspora]WBB98861.1 DUF805 domain-containing protein [Solwaraspora sp. WMMA2059]WBC22586.1 DUF805 domain-containing protein [Solwaraspora sp. WMMA2080]WFE19617.1 DUF805 domain-containing protein [Solwaraspora sp. WMMD937]WJK35363.1 DUF805 domain-containing protein [Solwaraspora sp. WMMA2065]
MSFTEAVRSALTRYVGFSGRARRAEYWWFVLFSTAVAIVGSILDLLLGTGLDGGNLGILYVVALLALALPSLAVAVRRLHDTERSGWWVLISPIPLIGPLVMLIFTVQDGTPGPNRFGPSPKY